MLKAIDYLGNIVSVLVDHFTNFLICITGDHAYTHKGMAYSVTNFDSALGAGSATKLTLLTPESNFIHLRLPTVSTSGDKVTVDLYEGSSGNSGGTPATPTNRNRNSSNTSACTIKTGVTVSTNGTLIDKFYVGGGTGVGSFRSGSESGDVDEIVLKSNTLYTVVVTNGSPSENNILTKLKWYEETNG